MPWKNKEAERKYKKKYYQENKEGHYHRTKYSSKKWRSNNRLKVNKIARDNYNPVKAKHQWDKVKDKHNTKGRIETESLTEKYMIKQLKKAGYTIEQLKSFPELIDTHRQIIKTKRLCKQQLTTSQI